MGERVTVMAPIVRGRKGEFKDLLDQLDQQGFRARIDGELRDLSEPLLLDRRKNHTIEAVIDRILLKPPAPDGPPLPPGKPSVEKRLDTAIAKALQLANGLALVAVTGSEEQLFSASMACPDCGLDMPKLEPRSFSFNSASSSTWPPTATRSTSNSLSKTCLRASSTSWSTARPRTKPRAPASTAFSRSCATPSMRPAATAIAST